MYIHCHHPSFSEVRCTGTGVSYKDHSFPMVVVNGHLSIYVRFYIRLFVFIFIFFGSILVSRSLGIESNYTRRSLQYPIIGVLVGGGLNGQHIV